MPFILIGFAVCCLIFLALWGSLAALKRRRLLVDLPTSKTVGVFIGLVELKGSAESEKPLQSFLAEKSCVWFSWTVQEHWSRTVTETYRDSNGKTQTRTRTESGWTTVASGGDMAPFYLRDDLGIVQIVPEKAKIHAATVFNETVTSWNPLYYGKGPAHAIANSTGKRCFTEKAISLHQSIYVVGQARERKDCVAAEVAYQHGAPLFLISTSTEESHRSSEFWKFWGLSLLAVLIPVAAGIALVQNATDPLIVFGLPAVLGATALFFWGIGCFWLVYNSLIGLKNRVRMATANIDIELKRRFDLIPQLLHVVAGMQQHERQVQETLALLRSQSTIQSIPGEGSTMAQGCAPRLVGLVEQYPELKADEMFLTLHKNLTETEQRIELARTYYNDVIEAHNRRCQSFPENLIATVAQMKSIPAFQAKDFVRKNLEIQLADC